MVPEKRKGDDISIPHDSSSPSPPNRSESHWFDDGNIILHAGNTLFKVHRGVLSKNSDVFRDMLALPQPPDQPTVENCSFVYIPDSEQDVHNFLDLIYSPPFDLLVSPKQPFAVLSAMIRLGHKYEAFCIRDAAVAVLQAEYPSDFHLNWSKLTDPLKLDRIIFYPGVQLDIFNLAQEYNLLTTLPALNFNISCCYNFDVFLDGIKRPDDSLVRMSFQHGLICASGAEQLRNAEKTMTFAWIKKLPYNVCSKASRSCANAGRDIYFDLCYSSVNSAVHGFTKWNTTWNRLMCKNCAKLAKEAHEAGRRNLWTFLPSAFKLGPWESLKNFE